jgi:P27 family predicted phage terminase small subunit
MCALMNMRRIGTSAGRVQMESMRGSHSRMDECPDNCRGAHQEGGARGGDLKNSRPPTPAARVALQSWSQLPLLKNPQLAVVSAMEIDAYERPPPPAHLSPSARQWWQTTVERYVLQQHHLKLLQLACEAWDETQKARERLAQDGLTVPGREGGLRPHPCVAIERDARLAVARLVRELDLDTEPPVPERAGPVGLYSNRGGRRARQTTSS